MGVNMKAMRRGYDSQQRGGEFWNVPEGETLVYVHPPCRENDEHEPTAGTNFIPLATHFGVGPNNGMVVCLDPEKNPVIAHPFIKKTLKERGVKLNGNCPVCAFIESGESEEAADGLRANMRYFWGITPIAFRRSASKKWDALTPNSVIYPSGKTVFDGIMTAFFECGDISDPDAAIYIVISRTGMKLNTKYRVYADLTSVKNPKPLSKDVRKIVQAAIKEGGPCDLFRTVANMIKAPSEVEAILSGVYTKNSADDDEDDDMEENGNEDATDDVEDVEEEEEAPKPKAAPKKRPVVEDDDDEEEDDEGTEHEASDEDDEDAEDGEDGEAEGEEDEEDDGEEEDEDASEDEDADDSDSGDDADDDGGEDDLGLDKLDEELASLVKKSKEKKGKAAVPEKAEKPALKNRLKMEFKGKGKSK